MKILIVSTVGMDRNGITTVIMNYYRLCKKDVQFDIVVNNYISEELKVEFEEAGSSVYVYQRKHVLNYIKNLNSLLREKKYDAIHVHGNSSTMSLELILAKMNNVLIRIAHCHNSECTHKIINKILKPLLNRTKTQALACSKLAGEWLFGNDFFVLPNGIDVGKFSFDLEKKKMLLF